VKTSGEIKNSPTFRPISNRYRRKLGNQSIARKTIKPEHTRAVYAATNSEKLTSFPEFENSKSPEI